MDDEHNDFHSVCMIKHAACFGHGCETCGFSYKEALRRKALPLVKLDNGLYGKKVGKRERPED